MADQDKKWNFEDELANLPSHIQHRVRAAKRNVGRPTIYRDDWPDKFRLLRASGQTIAQISSYLGCCEDTLYRMVKEHKEFSEAYKTGKAHMKAFFDDLRLRVILGTEDMSQARFLMFESGYKRMFAAGEHGYQLPDLHKQETDKDKFAYLQQALAEKRLTVEAYNMLVGTIKTESEHLKLEQLEQRLNDLEQMNE